MSKLGPYVSQQTFDRETEFITVIYIFPCGNCWGYDLSTGFLEASRCRTELIWEPN